MAKIAKQLTELIGHTPLLELTNYEKALGLEAKIIAKLEYFNPLGSVKDRVAATVGVCVKIYFFHKYENSLLAKQSVLQNVS